MILYDKECNLLGISKNILDFLGYEDMEEFKTYTNDVADLFQNRSGYIHRFKNFSWINYILHSGAPNKNAILILKNGKEAEVRIAIEEIISFENGHEGAYYKVNLHPTHIGLSSAHLKASKLEPLEDSSKETSFLSNQEDLSSKSLNESLHESNDSILFTKTHQEEPSNGRLNVEMPKEPEVDFEDFSLKINIEPEPQFEQAEFEQAESESQSEPEPLFTIEQSEKPFIMESDPVSFVSKEDLEPYDSKLALDALEIEPEELEAFLQEYCDHVEMVAIALEDAIAQNDNIAKNALLAQLKGVSEHLQIKQIVRLLDTLYETNDANALDDLQAYAHSLKKTHIKHSRSDV